MQAAARPYVLASAALLATSMVAATPLVARQLQLPIRSIETRLADAGSVLNIPFNLFQDIVNIPNTEVQAINEFANSLLFGGTWVDSTATNLWGEDPGDPAHFMSIVDMLVPFSQISGLGQPEIDPTVDAAGTAGLGQQIALMLDAEIPVSASCDAAWCGPLEPAAPITGLTSIDQNLWFYASLFGLQKNPLLDNWFQVPSSDLTNGYTFPTVTDPSAGVGANGGVPGDFGFPGTTYDPATGENLMPWSNLDFTLNLSAPFQNFYNSLLAPPDLNGFEIPSFEQIGYALQNLAAALVVDFYPFIPGSAACYNGCALLPDFVTTQGIVQAISNLLPGNPSIDEWLKLAAAGQANGPTQAEINYDEIMQHVVNTYDFGNPLPDSTVNPIPVDVSPAMQNLIDFMQNSGVQDFVHEIANLSGFIPLTYPLDLTDSATGLDLVSQLLADFGLTGLL